jgi:acyl-CoA synthetase (AMP-forming)/AMP-acid ligase II
MPSNESKDTNLAAIVFTSGSTGIPKGVAYSQRQLACQIRALQDLYDIRPGDIDLSTFPIFALYAPILGVTSIIPEMDMTRPIEADPQRLIAALSKYDCTSTFLSPALLDKIGRYCTDHSIHLPKLKRIVSAGASVSPRVLERFVNALGPNARIHTTYGATEAMPIASIDSCEILQDTRYRTEQGAGVCVGHPVNGLEVCVIPISDSAVRTWSDKLKLPANSIGEIVVKGPFVTTTYCSSVDIAIMTKVYDPDTGDVWHRMGDVGYFDTRGRLWFCGRKDHRVPTDVGVLFTEMCEAVFNNHPKVYRSALVGVRLTGEQFRPVVCVETYKKDGQLRRDGWAQLKDELQRMAHQYNHTRGINTFLYHSGFPVDARHNAKIRREEIAAWASIRLNRNE